METSYFHRTLPPLSYQANSSQLLLGLASWKVVPLDVSAHNGDCIFTCWFIMCRSPIPNKWRTLLTPAAVSESFANLPGYFWQLLATSTKGFWLQRALGQAEGGGVRALRYDYWRWCNSPCSHVMSSNITHISSFFNQNLIFQQEAVCGTKQDSRTSTVIKARQQTNLLLIHTNKTLWRWSALKRTGMYM